MQVILYSVIVIGSIGLVAAFLLWYAAKRFAVKEDSRISEIEDLLPGANCGGCGLSGCHAFAKACTEEDNLEQLHCTGISGEELKKIASIMGSTPVAPVKKKALVRCSADCDKRTYNNHYDGPAKCSIVDSFYQGESDCLYGCLGCGDCVDVCQFGAMELKPGDIPRVDFQKCTGCGKCATACPRNIIKIETALSDRLTYVACSNHDKGAVAMKVCSVSCIGCSRCMLKCEHHAVKINEYLAEISQNDCSGCGKCIKVCPRKIITTT